MQDAPAPATVALPRAHRWRRQWLPMRRALREHSLLIAIVALQTVAGFFLPGLYGLDYPMQLPFGGVIALIAKMVLWVGPLALAILSFLLMRRRSRRRLIPRLQRVLRLKFFRATRIWGGLTILLLLIPFLISTSFFKGMIPLFHPFDWDPTLAQWDRLLHFGREPWQWLQPVLGFPIVTGLLSMVYDFWFLVLYGVMIWQAFDRRDPVLRMQYFIATILIWILLGNVAATLLSSAGPAFYGRVTGLADPYAPLMDYLRAANLRFPNWSLHVQDVVWGLIQEQGTGGKVRNLISAMPSLHLGSTFSFFLLARATNRRLARAFGVFMLLMVLGSIHLAWHYALDVYAGILGAGLIWLAAGWLVRNPVVAGLLWGRQVVKG